MASAALSDARHGRHATVRTVPGALDVEVLVVSYNSADTLAACLASVERAGPGTPIAIREHGTDPAASAALDALAADHPGPVRVERDPGNPGFGAGCNALAAGSVAEYLLFLNPDAEIVDWPYTADAPPPNAAIVGPLMVESGHPAPTPGRRTGSGTRSHAAGSGGAARSPTGAGS
jgi:GT2 family glycosyltransferase